MTTEEPALRCPDKTIVYKTVGDVSLSLDVFLPTPPGEGPAPVIVWYHGGGWTGGVPGQFYPQSADLAKQGVLSISVEYRIKKKHGTGPYECMQDAFDAMRYVKAHVEEWGGDPAKIAAGGGSAGAHLASTLATVTAEDLAGTPEEAAMAMPDLLLLFNPVFNNGPKEEGGWGHERVEERWEEVSPAHRFHPGVPPMLVMLGDNDALIPVSNLDKASATLTELNVPHEFIVYPGGDHGFFNEQKHDGVFYHKTFTDLEAFLRKYGWVS